jgi:uncharacterized protein (DUF433 family)
MAIKSLYVLICAMTRTPTFGLLLRRQTRTTPGNVRRRRLAPAERTGQTGVMTSEQLEMISTNPHVMHGQAVIAGTRVPVSVILDCLAGGMTADQITTEYPSLTTAGVRAAAAYGAALARDELLPIRTSGEVQGR